MKPNNLLAMLALIQILSAPVLAYSAVPLVSIDGVQVDATDIGGTYSVSNPDSVGKDYEISGGSNDSDDSPRVEADDSDDDSLKLILRNVVITALDDQVEGHIWFWAELSPSLTGPVDLEVRSRGCLARPSIGKRKAHAAKGGRVQISGFVQASPYESPPEETGVGWKHLADGNYPPAGQERFVAHKYPRSHANINPPVSHRKVDVGNGPFLVKGDIWFYLEQEGDQLIFPEKGGVVIRKFREGNKKDPFDRPTCKDTR